MQYTFLIPVLRAIAYISLFMTFPLSSWAGVVGGGGSHDFGGCGVCHSVHNSAGGIGAGFAENPVFATDFYTSPTLQVTIDLNGVNNSDAPLCLGCHDGASLAPGTLHDAIFNTDADLTTDLSNDHPIGFLYADALADPEIQMPSDPNWVSYGPTYDQMWCSSCHDSHASTPGLLHMSNAGSALCLECHVK